jgi:hypothetical protein
MSFDTKEEAIAAAKEIDRPWDYYTPLFYPEISS